VNVPGNRENWCKILRDMRFIVAIDIIPNETNEFADVILPAHDSSSPGHADERRGAHRGREPAPAGHRALYDTKSEEEIFYELSERLGFLGEWNDMLNHAIGFTFKPELLLDRDKRYTDREIARRKGLLWNGRDLDWYIEHATRSRRGVREVVSPWKACASVLHRGPAARAR